jgi:hypothetical protein
MSPASPLRRRLLSVPLLPLLLQTAGARAQPPARTDAVTLEGVSFDRRITLGADELVLNGTGVRQVAWFKGYVAALYLPARARGAAAVLEQGGARRLRLVLLHEAPAGEFSKAFDKGVSRNTPPEALTALRARMAAFHQAVDRIGTVARGDVIDLDHEPARGTVLSVNGTLKAGPIAGADFYAALLRAFVGERPYDKRLRAGLVGESG